METQPTSDIGRRDPLDGVRIRGRRAGGQWTIILTDGKLEGFGSGSIIEEAMRSAAEDLARQRSG